MSFDMERKREQQEYVQSQLSLKRANYRMADTIEKRCNVCNQGQTVLGTGIRLCKQHIAFVTCGATCDLQIHIEKDFKSAWEVAGHDKEEGECMSKCEHPSCEQKGEERVYRGHHFLLCEIHFDELKGTQSDEED